MYVYFIIFSTAGEAIYVDISDQKYNILVWWYVVMSHIWRQK